MIDFTKRHLISDLKVIDKLNKQFELISGDKDNLTKIYLDKTNNQKWFSYYVDGYLQGGGYNIFSKLPVPTTQKLVEIALNSEFDDEVFACCRTLTEKEQEEEFREILINRLELHSDKERTKKIIELTGLLSELNKREILGKSMKEIEKDARYFKSISERAKSILTE